MTREEEIQKIEAFAAKGLVRRLPTLSLEEHEERCFAMWRAGRKAMRNAGEAYAIIRRGRRRRK